MARNGMLTIDYSEFEKFQEALLSFEGNSESAINDVLHTDAAELIQTAIYRLMPRSNKKKGKHAKDSKSLTNDFGNLSVAIAARGKWHYLYFPDDGSNTRRHVGNQQFFARGGEEVKSEIIDRCIARLTNNFENEV